MSDGDGSGAELGPRTPPFGLIDQQESLLSFDRYAELVRDVLGVPAAIVSMVGKQAQTFPGASGLPEPWQTQRWSPLVHSLCLLVIADAAPVAVPDARLDQRTSPNPAIADLDLIAYLGVPLRDGAKIVGAVCAIDNTPRDWSERDIHLLTGLTAACSAELSLRGSQSQAEARQHAAESARDTAESAQATAEQDGQEALAAQHRSEGLTAMSLRSEQHSRLLLAMSEALTGTGTVESVIQVVQEAAITYLGADSARFQIEHSNVPPDAGSAAPAATPRTLSVPLSGSLAGQLTLTWAEEPDAEAAPIEPQVQETVVALAHYASTALDRAILLQERRSAAATLQHAMLTTLPSRTDVELAARYLPAASANQVGGDWYDAVTVDDQDSGDLGVVIGDVAGHDIDAAATMGQVRSILRGLLVDRPQPPAEMITRLDAALARLRIQASSSLILALIQEDPEQPQTKRLSWANAGHPQPLRIDATGKAELLPGSSDLLLGIPYHLPRNTRHADLRAGDLLVLYTDGLIQRPGQSLAAGQEELARVATEHHRLPLTEALDRILQDLISNAPEDDCAILGVRVL